MNEQYACYLIGSIFSVTGAIFYHKDDKFLSIIYFFLMGVWTLSGLVLNILDKL